MTVGVGFNFVLLFEQAGLIVMLTLAMIMIKAVSLLLPSLMFSIPRTGRWLFASGLAQADDFDESNQVIVAGHGRMGGVVNRMLKGAGYNTTVIDVSSTQLHLIRTFGVQAYFGDATRPDLLESADICKEAQIIVAIRKMP